MLIVESLQVGALKTNCYVLKDSATKVMAIIDPGGISTSLDAIIKNTDKDKFKFILLTHGHFDHVRKVARYKGLTGAKVVMSKNEKDFVTDETLNLSNDFGKKGVDYFAVDVLVDDNDIIMLGETTIKVLLTPGHTKGGVCFLADNCLFTGDTLMNGTIGRVDFKSGNMNDMSQSLIKLNRLNGDCIVYPGHGDSSTLIYEKNHNTYLKKYRH